MEQRMQFEALNLAHFFNYPNEAALRPLSITAQSGDLIGIMGASGSGKSTLLNILNGSLKPTFGEVYLNGQPRSMGGREMPRAASATSLSRMYSSVN